MAGSRSLTLEAVVVAVLLLLVQGMHSGEEHVHQQACLQNTAHQRVGRCRLLG